MKVKVWCAMNLQGAELKGELDLEDDLTPEQIEEFVREWAMDHFEWGYEEGEC